MIERQGRFRFAPDSSRLTQSDVYVWAVTADVNAFVQLVPTSKATRDEFMIELAWGKDGVYPMRSELQNKQRLDVTIDARIRLPSLWREQWRSALEPWWQLGPSAVRTGDEFYTDDEIDRRLARISALVEDVAVRLDAYGIPLFERVAASRQTN